MRRVAVPLLSTVLTLSASACGDDKDSGSDSNASATTGLATGTSGATEGTGVATEATTGVPFEPYPAHGVSIIKVEANPGVAVPIGLNGGAVGGSGRNAYIPPRRDTLIRAYVTVPEGWVTRTIRGVLKVTQADGTVEEFEDEFEISSDSRESAVASGPFFGIPADLMQPGVKYSISLWETEFGHESEPEGNPIFPYDGSNALVGVEDSYQNMRVVLVPVDYSYGGCNEVVDAEALLKSFEDAIFEQNGLESIELIARPPHKVTYDLGTMNGLSKLVNEMSQLRAADGAPPEVYYYGSFKSCGKCIGGGGGINAGCTVGLAADITGPAKSDASGRAAAGQLDSIGGEGAAPSTFVHEIGHTQGRRHIDCPNGGAAGTDPSYPYSNGNIGVWGFGIRDFGLHHPTATKDYMSYCGPTWCSDWQWNATYERIRTLSAWENEAPPADPGPGPGLLIGAITPDGEEEWWTVPGSFDDVTASERSSDHVVRFTVGGQVFEEAAKVSVRPHYPVLNVKVPLPEGFDPAEHSIRFAVGDDERTVELDPGKIFHRPAELSAR
ncbi:MAG: hypothetical protein H6711_06720 [Myxococcales bacterium]|nr:hypothetical protein [Myxococcales bacterium]